MQDPQNCRAFAGREKVVQTPVRMDDTGHHAEESAVLAILEHSLRMDRLHVAGIQRIQNPRLWFNFAVRRYPVLWHIAMQ